MKLLILFLLVTSSLAARILFLNPMGSKSHKIFFMGITEALAKRGHQVTMVSSFKSSTNTKNIRDVLVKDNDITSNLLSNIFEDSDAAIKNLLFKSPNLCSNTLAQPQIQDLKKEQYDLIILSMFFSECYLSFVHHFKIPFIYISPAGLFGPFSDMVNNIEFPSLSPNKLVEAKFPQTFVQRLQTILLNEAFSLVNNYYVSYNTEKICREKGLCPEDMPSLHEIRNNVSLVVINAARMLEYPPRPVNPNIIYAAGAHIKPAKSLPKDLDDWVKGAGEDGFIFFSLGSAVKPSSLPEKYRQILINVFGSLKQRVLWKWDEDSMPGLPENVKISKWLPQQDILGHPKLKLFITHGGFSSTLESIYNGISVIGIPVFADQFSNMKEAEINGWARMMRWNELEEETFRNLIIDTMKNESLREVSKRRSAILRDVPLPPDEEAAFWIEYVIRHKGAPHIMSPIRNMSWIEVYNMDVYALLLAIALGIVYMLWRLLKFFLRICCGFYKADKKKSKRD